LTNEERSELDGLARSTKTEHRMHQRAQIVLLAADGIATRAIGRAVGCTTGTASKWRVRYAERRLAGLDETGERGAERLHICQQPKLGHVRSKIALSLLKLAGMSKDPSGAMYWTTPTLVEICIGLEQLRLPAIYEWREFAEAGGLMSYGTSLTGAFPS
jgi:transposase-like protein